MNNFFLEHVLPRIKHFESVTLSSVVERDVRKRCVELMNFKNESELKLKHEGFSFFDTFSKELLGLIALKKHLSIWDKNEINNIQINFNREIVISKLVYKLIVFDFGEMPVVEKENILNCIFILRHSNQKFYICGAASIACITNNENRKAIKQSIYNDGKTGFIGFNKLVSVNTL